MSSSDNVVSGGYHIYTGSKKGYYWGLDDMSANTLAQFLGIWINVMLPRMVKLILRIHNLAYEHVTRTGSAWPGTNFARVDGGTTIEGSGWARLLYASGLVRSPNHSRGTKLVEALKGVLLLLIYIGFIVCGVFASKLTGDDTSLARSSNCDLYLPDFGGSIDQVDKITNPYEFGSESQSADYARRCYGKGEVEKACDLFMEKDIQYTVQHNAACPFEDSMCFNGANSAFTLTTGAVPAHKIGVNTKQRYEFERTTTCSPLNMNSTFINSQLNGNITTYSYNYGRQLLLQGNTTLQTDTYGDFVGKGPSYSVTVFNSQSDFRAIPALDVGPFKLLTILFVQPQKILYTQSSDDPIFPTTGSGKIIPPYLTTKSWLYEGGHARALACVDSNQWRDRDKGLQWHPFLELFTLEALNKIPGDLRLFLYSQTRSSIYHSINKRRGGALNASSLITIFTSLPIAKEQWKVEVKQLFETSLARISLEARNIALGEYAKYPGYKRRNVDRAMCDGTYVFRQSGWSSLNGKWYLIVLIPTTLIMIFAFPCHTDAAEESVLIEIPFRQFGKDEWVAYWCAKICYYIWNGFKNSPWFVRDTFISVWAKMKPKVVEICGKMGDFMRNLC